MAIAEKIKTYTFLHGVLKGNPDNGVLWLRAALADETHREALFAEETYESLLAVVYGNPNDTNGPQLVALMEPYTGLSALATQLNAILGTNGTTVEDFLTGSPLTALAASADAMAVFAADAAAMTLMVASATAMTAVAANRTAVIAISNSAIARSKVVGSNTAKTALANSALVITATATGAAAAVTWREGRVWCIKIASNFVVPPSIYSVTQEDCLDSPTSVAGSAPQALGFSVTIERFCNSLRGKSGSGASPGLFTTAIAGTIYFIALD